MRPFLRPEHRENLTIRYTESHRHYHNLEHITILFNLASAHGIRLSIPQQLAIWYHDCVYDPKSKNNEENSCQILLDHHENEPINNHGYLSRAINIIMDTKTHTSNDHESQTVLDLDLAGLGFDFESYQYATKQIRQEYQHLTYEEWVTGRKIFLNNLLSRKYIFHTPWARDFYETKARRNIERELKWWFAASLHSHGVIRGCLRLNTN